MSHKVPQRSTNVACLAVPTYRKKKGEGEDRKGTYRACLPGLSGLPVNGAVKERRRKVRKKKKEEKRRRK